MSISEIERLEDVEMLTRLSLRRNPVQVNEVNTPYFHNKQSLAVTPSLKAGLNVPISLAMQLLESKLEACIVPPTAWKYEHLICGTYSSTRFFMENSFHSQEFRLCLKASPKPLCGQCDTASSILVQDQAPISTNWKIDHQLVYYTQYSHCIQ